MQSRIWIALTLAAIAFCSFGCKEEVPYTGKDRGSFTFDLETIAILSDSDESLLWSNRKPQWLADDMVFYLDSKIFRRVAGQNSWLQILPDTLDCSGTETLSFSPNRQRIFFCANGDVYSCGLQGENLINHTPGNADNIINPRLSADGRFISAIKTEGNYFGRVVLLNLETGDLTEVPNLEMVRTAYYNPNLNSLVYTVQYPTSQSSFQMRYALADGSQSRTLVDIPSWEHTFQMSHDGRFYTGLSDRHWLPDSLYIYDAITDTVENLGDCTSTAMEWNSNVLYYGNQADDYLRLKRYFMETGNTHLIYDTQYFGRKLHNCSSIYIRGDDKRMNCGLSFKTESKEEGQNEITN